MVNINKQSHINNYIKCEQSKMQSRGRHCHTRFKKQDLAIYLLFQIQTNR